MSSEDNLGESGAETARNNTTSSLTSPQDRSLEEDGMKRAAARHLIERYYYQLIDGCGNSECNNTFCASSQQFTYGDRSKDARAVEAIQLFKMKAKLCESNPSKFPKLPYKVTTTSSGGEACADRPSTSSEASMSTGSFQKQEPDREVKFLSEEILIHIIEECKKVNDWSKLIRFVGSVFNNPASLMLSFSLKSDTCLSKEALHSQLEDEDKDDDTTCKSTEESMPERDKEDSDMSDTEHSMEAESCSDIVDAELQEISLDMASLHRSYHMLMEIPGQPFQGALITALLYLSRTLDMELRYQKPIDSNPKYIKIFLIVMEIPQLHSPEFIETAYPNFCKATGQLPMATQAKLAQIWSKFSPARISDLVQSLQQLITVKIVNNETRWGRSYAVNDDESITSATRVLKILYYASLIGGGMDPADLIAEEKVLNESEDNLHDLLQGAVGHEPKEPRQQKEDPLAKELGINAINCRNPIIPLEEFVNDSLNDVLEVGTDYTYYRAETEAKFSFVNHNFILTSATKHTSMYYDNRIRMLNERRTSLLQNLVHGAVLMPFLRLQVRRDHLIDDSLVALEMVAMDNPADLKKQLFVEFEGEQGLDEGGVSKEFFQLVVEEIFNPDFGMFTYSDETHQFWFNLTSFENDGQFSLIGIVLGLAIYNNAILDIHFPMVVYRKLLGKMGTFQDLCDVDPTLANSLQELLDFEGDVSDVFMHTFRIGYRDVFGSNLIHDLKDKGDQILVTNENRKEFVNLYADFLLNKSIEKQFKAFKGGFQLITNESPLRMLFRPEEVELLVCGSKNFDFYALEGATDYDGGFTKDSRTIRHFWEIIHEFSEEQKRKLLQFTTGTDRVPVGGLCKLKLIIARNGPDSERLPTSHTCFNVLLLPDYVNKEKLRERLVKAITYSKGFGML